MPNAIRPYLYCLFFLFKKKCQLNAGIEHLLLNEVIIRCKKSFVFIDLSVLAQTRKAMDLVHFHYYQFPIEDRVIVVDS